MPREIITRRNLPHWYVPTAVHFVTYRLVGTIPMEVLQGLRAERDRLLKEKRPAASPEVRREDVHKQFFAGYDQYLDAHRDVAWLAEPAVAALVRENLYHHDGGLYHPIGFCIMPNHVHALIQPTADLSTSEPLVATQEADLSTGEPLVGRSDKRLACRSGVRKRAACGYDLEDRTARPSDEYPDRLGPLASIMRSLKGYTAHEANKRLKRSGQFWQHESYDHWVRNDEELERIADYITGNPVKAGLAGRPADWFWSSAHDRFLRDGTEQGMICSPAPP